MSDVFAHSRAGALLAPTIEARSLPLMTPAENFEGEARRLPRSE